MSAESAAGVASAANTGARLPRRSFGGLIAISIFWLALNLHWGAIQGLILPNQVYGLLFHIAPGGTALAKGAFADANKNITYAIVTAPGLIVALISNPLFGLFSDRTPGRFGRRRPYILIGTAVNVVGLMIMAIVPSLIVANGTGNIISPAILVLIGGLMLTQLANNAAAAPFHALLPDLVPAEQRGLASGIMGVAQLAGQIGGFVLPLFFSINSDDLLHGTQSLASFDANMVRVYAAIAVIVSILAVLTFITVRERPWSKLQMALSERREEAHTARDLTVTVIVTLAVALILVGILDANLPISALRLNTDSFTVVQVIALIVAAFGAARAFGFKPSRAPDFSWVLITRMFIQGGIYIVYTQLNFYMKDVVKPKDANLATTEFLVLLTLSALIASLIAGGLSDRFGRKMMVYVSGAFMVLVGFMFVLALAFIPPGLLLTVSLVGATIFGLGYGAYISVDWALVADVLPSEETFARDMGVWNIALTVPQAVVVIIAGWLLAIFGQGHLGYSTLFIAFVILAFLGTVTVRNIKGIPR